MATNLQTTHFLHDLNFFSQTPPKVRRRADGALVFYSVLWLTTRSKLKSEN